MSLFKDLMDNARREPSEYEKKVAKVLLLVILPIVIVGVAFLIYFNVEWKSVDEAISKYDFEEARQIASDRPCRDEGNSINGRLDCPRTLQLLKVLVSEANYMADNKRYDKAFDAIEEINSLELYNKLYEAGQISKSQADQKDELYVSVITKGMLDGSISNQQLKIYFTKISSKDKKEELRSLID
jgi:hypothetical protein